MIWTAIFENQTVKIFSTQFNSYEEAKAKAWELCISPLFVLIKGSHPTMKFF